MSPAKKPLHKLPATVELDGAVRLAGGLLLLEDGKLQLSSVRVLDDTAKPLQIKVPPVREATLNLGAMRDSEGFIDNVEVNITGTSGTTLELEFRHPGRQLEQRCLSLLKAYSRDSETIAEQGDKKPIEQPEDVLQALQNRSLEQLEKLLKNFLTDLSNQLFDLSAKSKQATSGENFHYEAMNAIKKNGMRIIGSITATVNEYYSDLTPDKESDALQAPSDEATESLDLVDIKEFEENLAVARIINLGENLHDVQLECLILRLAQLIDQDPHTLRLPVHVGQLCVAFQHAIEDQGIPNKAMPDIFDYFGQKFIQELDEYYRSLNTLLRQRDIRPTLEEEIRTKGSVLSRLRAAKKPRETKPGPASTPDETVDTSQPTPAQEPSQEQAATAENTVEQARELREKLNDRFSPESLYESVINALNFKRESGTVASGPAEASPVRTHAAGESAQQAAPPRGKLTDARSIADILGQMQQDAKLRSDVLASDSLREYLSQNQGQISGLKGSSGLTPDSLNQLDLVDNMFGSIKSQMDVTDDLKPALGNLQIPLARLALLEPQFFLDRDHAARGVMDKLAQLTTAANFPNKVLENRIQGIIDTIVTDYENDSAVFDTALAQVDKLVGQQERVLTRNVERVVRTQEGNEKLKEAQRAVDALLGSRIVPPSAPTVLINLVDSGFRDLLVLTHIKQGPDSDAWNEHINTVDLLSKWLGEQHGGNIDEDLLMQRAMEAEPLIDMIDQQISAALPTHVDHEPVLENLREILAGREAITVSEVATPEAVIAAPAEVRAKIENLPRLRRWIRRVEELEKGTWLSYRDKSGKKRRMQLAWISEAKDRYIFVNERGQKNADLTSVQLARQLGRGVQPPPPSDKLSLVDRSMFETLENVQKSLSFAKNHDTLTRLINRDTFIDQMNRAYRHAQRKHSQHAILCLNIDQFSLVNEIYDRVNGDQVLTEFARLLAQLHGRKSSSARLQGDEFAVLLLDQNINQAARYAEKIRSDIEASSVEIEGEKVTFTVSIGVAPILEYCPGVEEILESARTTMHRAKKQGRNCVLIFEEDKQRAEEFQAGQALTRADIKHTIETDRFVLRAQPIVQTHVRGDTIPSLHYELLLTLSETDGSLTSPQEFIENAERFGYMTVVDRWVVKEAFKWISQLIDNQKVVPNLSINLSGTSVTDDAFMEYLLEQISEFGVGTNRLCFEITETGTISNLVKAADFVRTFRNIGCKFSIDDFGTGLASHNYLRELPVDYVKIDGTFITGISENRNDYAMARSINDLAHFLGQETIAESVENEAIIKCLQEIGVDYLQGWGVGKPRLLTDVTEELSSIER